MRGLEAPEEYGAMMAMSREGLDVLRDAPAARRARLLEAVAFYEFLLERSEPIHDVLLAFALVLAFAYVFSWISAFVGLTVRNPGTAQSIGFVWVLPLVFASSAHVPTAGMPEALQTFAEINRSPWSSTPPARSRSGMGAALGPALGTLGWLIAACC